MKRFWIIPFASVLAAGMAMAQVAPTPAVPATPQVPEADVKQKHKEEKKRADRVYARTMRGPNAFAVLSGGSYLGVGVDEITSERMAELKLREERGVLVASVDQDGPAAKAGIKEKDVIVSFNGQSVEGVAHLRRMIQETPAGRPVKVGIVRNGTPLTLNAAVRNREIKQWAMPDIRIAQMPEIDVPSFHMVQIASRYGVSVEDLTPQLAEYFGVKTQSGVLVRSVERGSPAETAGIRAGDVITKVNNASVSNAGEFRRMLRKGEGSLSIGVVRDKREQSLTIKVPEKKRTDETSRLVMPDEEEFDFVFDNDFDVDVDFELDEGTVEQIRRDLQRQRKQIEKAMQIVMG